MNTRPFATLILAVCSLLFMVSCEQQNKTNTMDNGFASMEQQAENGEIAEDSGNSDIQSGKKIIANIDDSDLDNSNSVSVGDGEHDYYKYDHAAIGTVVVTLSDIPQTLAEIKNMELPAGTDDIHDTPYLGPALLVCALNQAFNNMEECRAMLNYIGKKGHDIRTGVVDAYPSDWSQLYQYSSIPSILSYFEGATKQNNWTPSKPITMRLKFTQYSYTADEYVVRLQIKSAAKASPQFIEIWMEDTDGDGKYDYFYPTNYINLAHSLGVYK